MSIARSVPRGRHPRQERWADEQRVREGRWLAAAPLGARRILRDYDFVDPSLVRALYRSGDRLEGRDMLFELRLWACGSTLAFVVGEVSDATLTDKGRQARVWRWDYRTLEGHFEAGQVDYQVRKWLDTGEVEFRVSAFSRVAPIPNPVVRLGFHLLGQRKHQTQFGRRACEPMRWLTIRELRGELRVRTRQVGEGLVVRPAAS